MRVYRIAVLIGLFIFFFCLGNGVRPAQSATRWQQKRIARDVRIGKSYLGKKEYNKALTYFLKAHQISAGDPQANYYTAVVHLLLKEYNQAIPFLKQALLADPNNVKFLQMIADCSLAMDDPGAAKIYFQKALRLDANNGDAYIGLGEAAIRSGYGEEAVGFLKKARGIFENTSWQGPQGLREERMKTIKELLAAAKRLSPPMSRVSNSHGLAASRPEDGVYRTYYSNGAFHKETYFKNGKQDGITKAYFKNGSVQAKYRFANGLLDGRFATYYKNGAVSLEGRYKSGKLNGLVRTFDPQGKVVREMEYKDGKMISLVKFKDGKPVSAPPAGAPPAKNRGSKSQ